MLYIIAACVFLIIIATAVYQWKLSRHHGLSREEFIKTFQDTDIPDAIPSAVYDYYKSAAISKHFGISPDDQFTELFSAIGEDIEEDARELTEKLGLAVPVRRNLQEWDKPLATLRDMVLWLDWVRQQHQDQT
jgi:hypothetical protein